MSNLIKRTISGIAFVAVFVFCTLYGPASFCVLFAVVTALALHEFHDLVSNNLGISVNNQICSIMGVFLFLAFFCLSQRILGFEILLPYVLSLLYVIISELYLKRPQPLADWAYAFAGQIYIALPFALLNLLAFYGPNGYSSILPLSVFIFLWLNDTGAYCFGSMLHNKIPYKLFERISPNKSWIGSIGGGLVVLIGAAVIAQTSDVLTLPQWLGLGLVVTIFGTWGDLVESLFKRQFKIKDSGNFLPGHGGVLDRFDSALLAIPASVIYIYSLPYLFQ